MVDIDYSLLLNHADLLDQLLATTRDHIDIYDRGGRYLYASPAGSAIFGVPATELVGKTWHDLNVPVTLIEHQDRQREFVFQTGNPVSGDIRFPSVQGIRHYEYVLSPLRGRDGSIVAVVSTRHDVTELTLAKQTVQEVEEIAHLGCWDYSFATKQVYWSEGTYRIHGLSPGQPILTGEASLQYIHPDDHNKYQQDILEKFAVGESFTTDLRIAHTTGSLHFIEVRGKPTFDLHNTLTGFRGTVQDITDRKQVELALRESEARFAAIFESSPDAILITRLSDGQVLNVNAQFVKAFGYSRAEAIGQTTLGLQLWADPAERATVVAYLQTEPTLQTYEATFRCKSGETFVGLFSCQRIELGGQDCTLSVVRDIRDRKQAEAKLQENEARFRELSEASPANIYIIVRRVDGSYYFEHISRVIEAIHEIPVEQFLENAAIIVNCMHPEDRPGYEAKVQHSLETLEPFSHEWRIITPSGITKWLQGASCPKQRDGGEVAWYGAIIDITERKQAEAKLQERETLLRLFAQCAPASIAMFDRAMRYIVASQRWVDDYQLGSFEALIGRSHYDVFPGIPDHWRQVHQHCLAGDVAICDEELFVKADGTQQWISWEVHPWLTATDEIGGIIIFSEDITQRKQVEQALQNLNQSLEQKVAERTAALQASETQIRQQANREALLREITQRIRQSLDLSTIFDTACLEIRQWIQADRVGIFKFFPNSGLDDGAFVAEAVAHEFPSVLAISVHDHCFGEQYAPLYQQGRVQAIADINNAGLQDCHRDVLAQFHIRANLIVPLVQGHNLWGLLCIHQCAAPRQWQAFEVQVAQEISQQLAIAIQQASLFEQLQQELAERQLAEARLVEINHELVRATRLKDEFLANMSHELRTPLNAILGMSEGLQDHIFGAINEQQLKALQTVEGAGLHLLSLINDILDLAKVESGQIELDCTPTVIRGLCQSSLEFIKQQALKKNIHVELKLPPHLPELMLDERRIRQVLVNLLSNAVKFTPPGGNITLEISVTDIQSAEEATRPWLEFAVRDTGIGIAPENLAKLFQPFVQVDSALNRQYEGTGLGLALVKRIVELHGGQVRLTSEMGVGSCFTIDLPYVLAPSATGILFPPSSSAAEQSQHDPSTSPLILLVEDNEDNIVTVASYLEVKGYRLLLARNGQEALDLLQSECPDLILMDIQMPEMDGLEAIHQIRHDRALLHVPIIALTALVMEGDRERCLVAGANDYLSKPVRLKQLASMIQQFLESNQAE